LYDHKSSSLHLSIHLTLEHRSTTQPHFSEQGSILTKSMQVPVTHFCAQRSSPLQISGHVTFSHKFLGITGISSFGLLHPDKSTVVKINIIAKENI